MIGGAFGFIAYVLLFVGGIILILRGNIQGGLYLLLVSSLFYIGKAIMYHGDQYVRFAGAVSKALDSEGFQNTLNKLKGEKK